MRGPADGAPPRGAAALGLRNRPSNLLSPYATCRRSTRHPFLRVHAEVNASTMNTAHTSVAEEPFVLLPCFPEHKSGSADYTSNEIAK